MSDSTNPSEDLTPAEASLGKALALIHRALGRLDDPARKADVQVALSRAAALLDAARLAHSGAQPLATAVAPHIAAVIAAAVSVVLDRPHRLVSVQHVTVPVVSGHNLWAVEGRTQIFKSHKVR